MNQLILFFEILFFILLVRKVGGSHPFTIGYFVAFFYFNSVYIDYLLFNITPSFLLRTSIIVNFNSHTFFEYNILVFIFSFIFFFLVYAKKRVQKVSYFETYKSIA